MESVFFANYVDSIFGFVPGRCLKMKQNALEISEVRRVIVFDFMCVFVFVFIFSALYALRCEKLSIIRICNKTLYTIWAVRQTLLTALNCWCEIVNLWNAPHIIMKTIIQKLCAVWAVLQTATLKSMRITRTQIHAQETINTHALLLIHTKWTLNNHKSFVSTFYLLVMYI